MSFDFLQTKHQPDLVYRTAPHMDSLVFATPSIALSIDQIHEALSASTWAEFEYLMPNEELDQLIMERNSPEEEWSEEDKFRIPSPSAVLDVEQLCPQVMDGDYPQWLQKLQELWVPAVILERWGQHEYSMHNGMFWIIDPYFEKEILEELRRKKLKVEKREDLLFY